MQPFTGTVLHFFNAFFLVIGWKEAGSYQHRQRFAHASGQAAQDVMLVLLVDGCAGDVGLHLLSQQQY